MNKQKKQAVGKIQSELQFNTSIIKYLTWYGIAIDRPSNSNTCINSKLEANPFR